MAFGNGAQAELTVFSAAILILSDKNQLSGMSQEYRSFTKQPYI
jgi:hypothetical protein